MLTTFKKQVGGDLFTFTLNWSAIERAVIVDMENYTFVMMEYQGYWRILGEVPVWLHDLEDDLAFVISGEMANSLIGL